jgi:hypothetical protein
MSAPKRVALLCAAVLVAACARPGESPSSVTPEPIGTATGIPAGRAPEPTARTTGDIGRAGAPVRRTAQPASTSPPRSNDGGNPGANAPAYLRASVPRLVVEIDAVRGKAPQSETVALVGSRLEAVADKPEGIDVLPPATIPPGDGAWTFDELRSAEARHRDTHSTAGRASLYLLFVDGTPPRSGAIGVTYSASSAAIFVDQIADASTLLVGAAAIERAATVHEVGHLLSLLNFGYRSPRDREDPEHPHHSTNERSVMYWAVDNVGVVTILGGRTAPPTEFDADDLADLAAVRSGKLP